MSENNSAASGGIGIFGLMFIVLFIGKVFEIDPVTNWSWWWITAPLWGFPALILLIIAGIFVVASLVDLIAGALKKVLH